MTIKVVAEIGINHNGDIKLAKELINCASRCGCWAVKFQKRTVDVVYADTLDKRRESPWGTTEGQQKEGLELGVTDYHKIDDYCAELEIPWFASAWDIPSLAFLDQFKLDYHKVASAMLTHWVFIKEVASRGKLTFISTGGAGWQEIERALDIFSYENCPYVVMHCVPQYPADPAKDKGLMLELIPRLISRFGKPVGYSGHEVGLWPSFAAMALGAEYIERHITLDRSAYGSDQAASLEEPGLRNLVEVANMMPKALGDGRRYVTEKHREILKKLRWFENA